MKAVAILTLGAGLLAGSVLGSPPNYGHPQTDAGNAQTGRITGRITPKRGFAFNVYLMVPGTGTVIAQASADFVEHHGEFVLDGVRPGIYRLDVNNFGGGCGIFPWSQVVTVAPGKTTRIKVKLKIARHAICE